MTRHESTLNRIFADPIAASIRWADVESLPLHLGAEISEGRGSRVRVRLGTVRAVFHRPHPQPTTNKGAIKAVRRLLTEAGYSK